MIQVDVSIEQSSREYKEEIVPLALAAILIYPVGLVVLNSSLLFCARKAIIKKRSTTLSRATAFLHKEFQVCSFRANPWLLCVHIDATSCALPSLRAKLHLFWWELVEMLRRFLLVGLMVAVRNGEMLQALPHTQPGAPVPCPSTTLLQL